MTNQTLDILKNKIIILVAILFASVNAYSQIIPVEVTEKPLVSRDKFGEGYTLSFEQGRYELENSITADIYFQGKSKYEEGDLESAKNLLVEFVDSEIIGFDMNSEKAYPYNKYRAYKYEACMMLKEIYYKEKNYKRSFYYYESANKKFKYGFRCGFMDNNITDQDMYLYNCYLALGNVEQANQTILYKVFSSKPVEISLIKEIIQRLKEVNDVEYIKNELNTNIDNIISKQFSLPFLGYELGIFYLALENDLKNEYNITKAQQSIKKHLFYKLIMEN
jgi:hypothetical protein